MSLSMPTITVLEDLPNEILLLICRYLSSIDTLLAFDSLNSRLSQTISGYYEHVFIGQASYQRLINMCSSMLPKIGLNIRSLIVSNEWLSLVSKLFLEYFGEQMSSTFPHLESLTLVNFTPSSLKIFLNCLTYLSKLTELNIRLLLEPFSDAEESWMLLHQLFTCNNNRLTSIMFDTDSTSFFCESEDVNASYLNIEKLTMKLNSLQDFHNLLTIVPKIHSLDVIIEKSDFDNSKDQRYSPVYELNEFRLGANFLWNLEQLTTVIKRLPNVENLSIKISTENDSRLAVSPEFFDQLSSLPLKVLDYFLCYFDTSITKTTLSSTWQQFRQEPISVETHNTVGSMLYTLPRSSVKLAIPYQFITVMENSELINNCIQTLKALSLYDFPPDIAETYIILTKCRRINRLTISMDEDADSTLEHRRKTDLQKLPCLTSLLLFDASPMVPKNFSALVEASPNLYGLTLYDTTLQSLLDDDSSCRLLGQRITHLEVHNHSGIVKLDNVQMARLASVFPYLKYLCLLNEYIILENAEPLILVVINHLSEWNSLVSLSILNINLMKETCAQGIQHWISEHMSANSNNRSFLADYTDGKFRLWL